MPDFEQLQALRDCCQDEAAFEQLNPSFCSKPQALKQLSFCKTSALKVDFRGATYSCLWSSQGVAEATHQLLTNLDFAICQSLATSG